ncbi:MAG: 2-isopropylmalate synthase, partial [Oscillospiraceae bacterium]|nr:2-isopropylmalate synthase [Oscillospiraceae bacterium]
MNVKKYCRGDFPTHKPYNDWALRTCVEKAPRWCSVDLRDGNQALVVPMTLEQKLEFFALLVRIGFKEIEIGFPSASDTEYAFCRALIEHDLIPDDVYVQVLTQSREHIIRRTFEALAGAKNAIVHFYNSTSVVQREQVFCKSKKEIADIAVGGATLVKQLAAEYSEKNLHSNYVFEYSPESFTGTEPEYAVEICNAVLRVLEPSATNPVIINLPATVEVSMPHVYASQVEYVCANLYKREHVTVSLHTHNDRGCAIAAAEMGLLAGADRLEGTLFGNGERTGNADLVALALNLYSQGIDPQLDLSGISQIVKMYERTTGMDVHSRHPYCGELVFAAFSGSHQDAIAKSMAWRDKHTEQAAPCLWNVPYLPIDPADLGREYDSDVIRINAQSGKGGIGYILRRSGVNLPANMREAVGYAVKSVSDKAVQVLNPDEVYSAFMQEFVNRTDKLEVLRIRYKKDDGGTVVNVRYGYKEREITGRGNGQLDALSDALKTGLGLKFDISDFSQHAIDSGSKSRGISYVQITADGKTYWGAGLHTDIGKS